MINIDDEHDKSVDDFTGSASRGGEGLVRKLGDGNSPFNKILIIAITIIIIITIILVVCEYFSKERHFPLVDLGTFRMIRTCQNVIVAFSLQ